MKTAPEQGAYSLIYPIPMSSVCVVSLQVIEAQEDNCSPVILLSVITPLVHVRRPSWWQTGSSFTAVSVLNCVNTFAITSYHLEFKQANDYCKTNTTAPGIPLLAWTNHLSPARCCPTAPGRRSLGSMTSHSFARFVDVTPL